MKFFLTALVVTFVALLPSTVDAQAILDGVCSGTECSACDIAVIANSFISWLIGAVMVLFAVLMVIAGFGLVTSGGNPDALSTAKSKFTNAIIGLIIVLSAWLIVDTLMRSLVGDSGKVSGNLAWSEIQCMTQTEARTVADEVDIEIADIIIVEPGTVIQGAGGVSVGELCDEQYPGGPRTDCAKRIVACNGTPEVNQIDATTSEVVCRRSLTLSGSYTRCDTASFETVNLFGRSVQVHRDFAPALRDINSEWQQRGGHDAYPIYSAGGYRGCPTGSRSFHDYGFAVDINPDANPHCKDRNQDPRWAHICNGNQLVTDMPNWFIGMFTSRGWGWGGNWSSSKDSMHFSMGAPEGGSVPIPGR
jgi:hypothetical protein